MKIREVADALERFAPLPLEESYDNAGLQIGLTDVEVSRALLCLDVTEEIIAEAKTCGCNLIIAHHPLLFRGLKCVSDANYVQRCVREAVKNEIAIYAAHTNLDNAMAGVNFKIAEQLGLEGISFLQGISRQGFDGGSGVVGTTTEQIPTTDFLQMVKSIFKADVLMHNRCTKQSIQKVAVCGGAGEFLLEEAIKQEADAFITGEMSYHHYFGLEEQIQICVVGHYESEQYTIELLQEVLATLCPDLETMKTKVNTNAISYL